MQDRTLLNSRKMPVSSPFPGASSGHASADIPEEVPQASAAGPNRMKEKSQSTWRGKLDQHKGKLAISTAALLGLIVYYHWDEKILAQEDPEEYERLQRIKNRVRHADE